MVTRNDQLNELQRKNLDAAMRLAQLSIENSQRIMALQVETAKALFDEGMRNAREMAEARNPGKAMELRTHFAQATTEKMLGCARRIAEISSETQAEFGRLVGQHLTSGSHEVLAALQNALSGMPVADHNASSAIQSAMDTARAAFDQMSRASSEAFSTFSSAASRAAESAAGTAESLAGKAVETISKAAQSVAKSAPVADSAPSPAAAAPKAAAKPAAKAAAASRKRTPKA